MQSKKKSEEIKHSKVALNQEFKKTDQLYFESFVANYILDHSKNIPAVAKICNNMLSLLKKNKDAVITASKKDKQVGHELYGNEMYGRIGKATPSHEKMYDDVISVLEKYVKQVDEPDLLIKVMHIQAQYCYRFYEAMPVKEVGVKEDVLQKKDETLSTCLFYINEKHSKEAAAVRASIKSELDPFKVFKDRGRDPKLNKDPQLKNTTGTVSHSFFVKQMKPSELHRRAVDLFKVDEGSQFAKLLNENDQPFIAGPSGHTAVFVKGATLYGNFTQDEMNEYMLGVYAYLVSGGNHTFNEIYMVANYLGNVPFEPGSYKQSFPASFVQSLKQDLKNDKHHNVQDTVLRYLDKTASKSLQEQWSKLHATSGHYEKLLENARDFVKSIAVNTMDSNKLNKKK